MIPLVVASERGPAQTGVVATHRRGCRTTLWQDYREENDLESSTVEDDSSVSEAMRSLVVS